MELAEAQHARWLTRSDTFKQQDSDVYALIVTDEVYQRPVLIHRVTPNPSMYQHNGGASPPAQNHANTARRLVPQATAHAHPVRTRCGPPGCTRHSRRVMLGHTSCSGLLARRLGPSLGAGASRRGQPWRAQPTHGFCWQRRPPHAPRPNPWRVYRTTATWLSTHRLPRRSHAVHILPLRR